MKVISSALLSVLKGVYKLACVLVFAAAKILLFTGLWIPFIYLMGSILAMLIFNTNFLTVKDYNVLYIIGLILSFICAGAICIKKLLIKPIKEMIDYKEVEKEYDKRSESARQKKLYEKNPRKYYAELGMLPDKDSESYKKRGDITDISELPTIYRSGRNDKIIIHEFQDRFEVFLDKGDNIVHIDTKKR